ncbi:XTP/dITP diphosphatase [candidate division KSB1 bacterium]|nr:XTP/dITP diphosphatase [candidate division KSB1 bacterium]
MDINLQKIVVATNNEDKLNEIKMLLNNLKLNILSKNDFMDFPEMEETGDSLKANALLKARGTFQATGLPSIADDTGLEVSELNGAPGVYSSRYAGTSASYEDNVRKLLNEMENVPIERRGAQFRCAIAFVDGEHEFTIEDVCKGIIIHSPQGKDGFGYDPIFFVPEYGKSFAEMSPELKNNISHRGKALTKIKPYLSEYFEAKVVHQK